ncbi:hypothetical protein Jiend_49960 [Micromonospora endophytica]|nr:hypothetical protein Jiend_49960 [Micromonospora endophytica]
MLVQVRGVLPTGRCGVHRGLAFLGRWVRRRGKPELSKELSAARMAAEFLDRPGVLSASAVLALEAGATVAVLKRCEARRLEAIDATIAVVGAGHEAASWRCSAVTLTRTSMHGGCRSTCG